MTPKIPLVNIFKTAIIVVSLILWGIFGWIIITSLPSLDSLPEFLVSCIIVSIQNGSIFTLIAPICVSVYYMMYWMNYDTSSRINGIASVFYIYLILILLFGGVHMITMASSSVSSSNTTDSIAIQTQAMDTLGSGIYGNGIGIIGIALAIFGLLLTTLDKIQSSITIKTLVSKSQIIKLALGWQSLALFMGIVLIIQYSGIMQRLPNYYPITLMICGLLIEIIGLLILGLGYLKFKDKSDDSFNKKIQRVVMSLRQ
jgi:hypothetical protein